MEEASRYSSGSLRGIAPFDLGLVKSPKGKQTRVRCTRALSIKVQAAVDLLSGFIDDSCSRTYLDAVTIRRDGWYAGALQRAWPELSTRLTIASIVRVEMGQKAFAFEFSGTWKAWQSYLKARLVVPLIGDESKAAALAIGNSITGGTRAVR